MFQRFAQRVRLLITSPSEAFDEIAEEPTSVDALVIRTLVPLALLGPIATGIGMRNFDRSWDAAHGYLVPPEQIFAASAATLFATIASVLVLAGIFVLIAPMYKIGRDYRGALKVATWGAVPVLLASATLVLPVFVMLTVVAVLHTLYLYWVGVGRILGVAAGDRTEFVGISLTLLVGISTLAGAAASSIGLF